MAATVIDGKAAAARLRESVAQEAGRFASRHGRRPRLCVVIVGDNPASRAYVRTKTKMAAEAGLEGELIELPVTISTEELLGKIDTPQSRSAHPRHPGPASRCPSRSTTRPCCTRSWPRRTSTASTRSTSGGCSRPGRELPDDLLVPCTPYGCLHLLRETLGDKGLAGKEAVIVGRSNIVGKPMAALLLGADCTVTVAHSRTRDLPEVCRRADILVAALGPAGIHSGRLGQAGRRGDRRRHQSDHRRGWARTGWSATSPTSEAAEVAGAITPVPGGVGPMTVACLLRNTLIAARAQTR